MKRIKVVLLGLVVMGSMMGCAEKRIQFTGKDFPVTVAYFKDAIKIEYHSNERRENGTIVTIENEHGKVIYQNNGFCTKSKICNIKISNKYFQNDTYTGTVRLENGAVGGFDIDLQKNKSENK